MKQNILISIASIVPALVCSCGAMHDDDLHPIVADESVQVVSEGLRSPQEAVAYAVEIAGWDQERRLDTRASQRLEAFAITSSQTRSDGDTLMYVVEYGDEQGFALIAARKDKTPVVAYVEKGSFSGMNTLSNENFQFALESAIAYAGSKAPQKPIPNPSQPIRCFYTYKPKPLVKVAWGQSWPEGVYCPNGIAGCVPVATAQILTYLQPDLSLEYDFDEADISGETYDWTEITRHVTTTDEEFANDKDIHLANCGAQSETHKTIGRLIRKIGYDLNAGYAPTGTGVKRGKEYEWILAHVHNISNSGVCDASSLFENIAKKNTVGIVEAFCITYNGGYVGHCWIADGVWEYKEYEESYSSGVIENPGDDAPMIRHETVYAWNRYLHYNWGLDGNCNGYFLEDVFSVTEGSEYDDDDPISLPDMDFKYSLTGYWLTKSE